MHPQLLTVKARMHYIAGRCKSTVYIMSNQACLCLPVAATGKVEVPSVSRGYGAAETFLNDQIDA